MLSQQLQVTAIDAFDDNYIWFIHSQNSSNPNDIIIVDPGEDFPVLEAIEEHHYIPRAIFITHHHGDHTGGVSSILAQYDIPVYGPKNESIATISHSCQAKDIISFPELSLQFTVLDVPGHTRGHIAYHGHQSLFIGDTLFAGGCGKLFEGTHKQMQQSLSQLLTLNDSTLVYCAHEYTIDNLNFAIKVEPENSLLQQRIIDTKLLRQQNKRTVPSLLSLEKATNPFLRFNEHTVIQAAEKYTQRILLHPDEVFGAVRDWKDDID